MLSARNNKPRGLIPLCSIPMSGSCNLDCVGRKDGQVKVRGQPTRRDETPCAGMYVRRGEEQGGIGSICAELEQGLRCRLLTGAGYILQGR